MNSNGGRKGKRKVKPYWEMTADELRSATAEFDREIRFEETRPLTSKDRARWNSAKKRGRPKVGKGSRAVLITVERGLLSRADKFAKAHGTNRSRLIAMGLEAVLSGPSTFGPANGKRRSARKSEKK
jgi:hypothetical protein